MDMQTSGSEEQPVEVHRIEFHGDGATYFKVWIVNVLLLIVTVGLFTPAARRRTLKYFYSHTVLAGTAFEFTGALRRMFFGFLLFFGLYLAYVVAAQTGAQRVAGVIGIVWVIASPWLWVSSRRFRMASTRWRGITGSFTATVGAAFRASWPMIAFVAAMFTLALVWSTVVGETAAPAIMILLVLAAIGAGFLMFVRTDFNYTRLRVAHSSFGGLPVRWDATFGEFTKIAIAAVCIFVLSFVVFGLFVGLLLASVGLGFGSFVGEKGAKFSPLVALLPLLFMICMFLATTPALAYREARKFALIWNRAQLGDTVRFTSTLAPWPYVRLRIKNVLLTVLTLGLYRPFAAISELQRKLQSVEVSARGGLEQFAGSQARQGGAFADAVGEALGLDFG